MKKTSFGRAVENSGSLVRILLVGAVGAKKGEWSACQSVVHFIDRRKIGTDIGKIGTGCKVTVNGL